MNHGTVGNTCIKLRFLIVALKQIPTYSFSDGNCTFNEIAK